MAAEMANTISMAVETDTVELPGEGRGEMSEHVKKKRLTKSNLLPTVKNKEFFFTVDSKLRNCQIQVDKIQK